MIIIAKYKRICKRCGDEFYTDHPRQVYCRHTKVSKCKVCGKEFEQICDANASDICSNPECLKYVRGHGVQTKMKRCKVCGELFLPKTSGDLYCGNTHIRKCKVCGKEFNYKCEKYSDPDTCYECRGNKYKRICKICGKEFISSTPSKQICDGDHYRTCEICGKQFVVPGDRWYDESITTCTECSKVKRIRAIQKSQSKLPQGWNQAKTIYTRKCKWCGKIFTTNIPNKLYCDDKHYKKCEVCGKMFEVDSIQISNHTRVCSNECRVLLQSRSRFDCEKDWRMWIEFNQNPRTFIRSNFDHRPTYYKLKNLLKMHETTIQQLLYRKHCEDCVTRYVSIVEQQVVNTLNSIDSNLSIKLHERSIISPKEIDIYLPDFHTGIEVDPTLSHNSSKEFHGETEPLPYDYHKMKSDMCEDKGIFLFHLFGYDWTNNRDIITSMLRNFIGKSDKIYARKCKIATVSYAQSARFLDENHRQGNANASIRLGLFYNDELVSLMTFGRKRSTIGASQDYGENSYELIRFCNKLNTTVVGGASKLFKYFIKEYSPDTVISYSDRAHTRGNLYKVLGFSEIRRSDPGYVWVDTKTDIAYHRVNAQKQNIKKFLHDDSIDLSKTERQIMIEHGFVQVFDCGVITWKWTKEE